MQPNNSYFPSGPSIPPPMQQGGLPSPMAPAPMRGANNSNRGSGGLIATIVVLFLLLVGAGAFGYWAFTERQDYKNNVDAKVAAAVEVAKQETTDENNKKFAEEMKSPLKSFTGPAQFGSVTLQYPKTWSGYVDLTNSSEPLRLLFHPNIVPAVKSNTKEAIALKISVVERPYDQVVTQKKAGVERGEVAAQAYALPKMPDEVGIKFTGKITRDFTGTEIVIPLRDKTLIVTTETEQFMSDFDKYIVPNISFVP